MERNAEVLRRDARAPLCLKPLPRWRYEHAFRQTLREFLPKDSELLGRGVDFLAAHHAYAQEFVTTVDQVIVAGASSLPQIRAALAGVLDVCRRLAELSGCEETVEELREALAEGFQTEGGLLPEFCWEKGAAALFLEKLRRAGVGTDRVEEALFVHINDVYDDCARTIQLGLWIMAAPWRAEVVDTWLFESAYAFFHHTIPNHVAEPRGLVAIIPRVVSELQQKVS